MQVNNTIDYNSSQTISYLFNHKLYLYKGLTKAVMIVILAPIMTKRLQNNTSTIRFHHKVIISPNTRIFYDRLLSQLEKTLTDVFIVDWK